MSDRDGNYDGDHQLSEPEVKALVQIMLLAYAEDYDSLSRWGSLDDPGWPDALTWYANRGPDPATEEKHGPAIEALFNELQGNVLP